MNPPTFPGTDPSSVRRRYGLANDAPLLDFAARVNPFGPPPGVAAAVAGAIGSIGERGSSGCPRLVARLAEHHGVDPRRVIVGAGTTELIGLVGQSLRDVLAFHAQALGDLTMPMAHLVDPSSPDFRRMATRNELRAKVWPGHVLGWGQETLPGAGAAGIFCTGHPNNPTGRAWDRATLEAFAHGSQGLLTVVDESCLPFLADEAERTLIPVAARRDNVLVLRSFSHFHALPGLRVGYAIASPDMITRLRQFQDARTVTPLAEAAALAALEDRDYHRASVALAASEPARLLDRLAAIPALQPAWPAPVRPAEAPPVPPFLMVSLVQTDWTSTQVHEALARRRFLVRECSDFPGLEVGAFLTGPDQLVVTGGQLRINSRTPAENDLLVAALTDILGQSPVDAPPAP